MKKQYINPMTEWYSVNPLQVICASGSHNNYNTNLNISATGNNPRFGR